MAAPGKVPIARNVLMVDEKLQGGGTVSVAAILAECKTSLIDDWLVRTKKTPALCHLHLGDEERTGYLLPQLPRVTQPLPKGAPERHSRLINSGQGGFSTEARLSSGATDQFVASFSSHIGKLLRKTGISGNPASKSDEYLNLMRTVAIPD
jgi:hypothetical protein